VVTVHGPIDNDLYRYYHELGDEVGLVAISDRQRELAPNLNWIGRVHNALRIDEWSLQPAQAIMRCSLAGAPAQASPVRPCASQRPPSIFVHDADDLTRGTTEKDTQRRLFRFGDVSSLGSITTATTS
jgi:hypothetical protein